MANWQVATGDVPGQQCVVQGGELTQMVVSGNNDMPTMQSEDWQIGEQGVYRVR